MDAWGQMFQLPRGTDAEPKMSGREYVFFCLPFKRIPDSSASVVICAGPRVGFSVSKASESVESCELEGSERNEHHTSRAIRDEPEFSVMKLAGGTTTKLAYRLAGL